MKNIILIIAVLLCANANAQQVSRLSLQASGLTCSLCSNAIFKSLKSLDFVEKVDANIKNSSFEIMVKPGAAVDFDKVKHKVEDAGFFVARLVATIHFSNTAIVNDEHATVDNTTFHFLNTKDQVLNGDYQLRILDKGYVSAKEYKKNAKFTLMECYKTGVAGACCAKGGLPAGKRIFHVTI